MHEDSKCLICGTPFIRQRVGNRRMYCSTKCNQLAQQRKRAPRQILPVRICMTCLAEYTPKTRKQRFCSMPCRTFHNNHVYRYTNICEGCGKEYKVNDYSEHCKKRFCSLHCSLTYTVINRTLVCVDCGKSFNFVGRCKAKRCVACRRKWSVVRTTRSKQKRNPEMRVGVGSGGAQWGVDNHQWKPAEEHSSLRYRANWRLRCFRDWPKQCCACAAQENIEVHHVNGNPENFSKGNLIPLCFECHIHKVHTCRYKTAQEYVAATFAILPKKCRNKIAKLSGKAEKLIRTEGLDLTKQVQGQSIGTAETITSPRGRDILLAG